MKIKSNSLALKFYRRYNVGEPKNSCEFVLKNIFMGFVLIFVAVMFAVIALGISFALAFLGLNSLSKLGMAVDFLNSAPNPHVFVYNLFFNDPLYYVGAVLSGLITFVGVFLFAGAVIYGCNGIVWGICFIAKKIGDFLDKGVGQIAKLQDKHCDKIEIED